MKIDKKMGQIFSFLCVCFVTLVGSGCLKGKGKSESLSEYHKSSEGSDGQVVLPGNGQSNGDALLKQQCDLYQGSKPGEALKNNWIEIPIAIALPLSVLGREEKNGPKNLADFVAQKVPKKVTKMIPDFSESIKNMPYLSLETILFVSRIKLDLGFEALSGQAKDCNRPGSGNGQGCRYRWALPQQELKFGFVSTAAFESNDQLKALDRFQEVKVDVNLGSEQNDLRMVAVVEDMMNKGTLPYLNLVVTPEFSLTETSSGLCDMKLKEVFLRNAAARCYNFSSAHFVSQSLSKFLSGLVAASLSLVLSPDAAVAFHPLAQEGFTEKVFKKVANKVVTGVAALGIKKGAAAAFGETLSLDEVSLKTQGLLGDLVLAQVKEKLGCASPKDQNLVYANAANTENSQ